MTIEELKKDKPWVKRGTVVFMSDFGTVDGAVFRRQQVEVNVYFFCFWFFYFCRWIIWILPSLYIFLSSFP